MTCLFKKKLDWSLFFSRLTLKNIDQIYPKKQIFQDHVMNIRQSEAINRSMICVDFLKK